MCKVACLKLLTNYFNRTGFTVYLISIVHINNGWLWDLVNRRLKIWFGYSQNPVLIYFAVNSSVLRVFYNLHTVVGITADKILSDH